MNLLIELEEEDDDDILTYRVSDEEAEGVGYFGINDIDASLSSKSSTHDF